MLRPVTVCLYCGFDFPPDDQLPEREFCNTECHDLYWRHYTMAKGYR